MMQNAALRRPVPLERLNEEEPPRPQGRVLEHPAVASRRLPEAPSRRGRGLPMLLAAVIVFGLFGCVVWYAYSRGGTLLTGDPPLIHAEAGPYKHVPEDRGGLVVENQTASVINVFHPPTPTGAPETEILPPAQPSVRPDPAAGEQRLVATDPTDLSKLPPLPAPQPAAPPAAQGSPLQALEAPDTPAPPPAAAAPPWAAAPLTAAPAHAPVKAATRPAPARLEPVPPPALEARDEPAPAAGAPARQARPAGGSEPAALRDGRSMASTGRGAYRLQLASVKSEAAASQAWAQLHQRYPALADLSPSVERFATVGGTMYRLHAGPFAGYQAAAGACAAIQAQGGQCFVTIGGQ